MAVAEKQTLGRRVARLGWLTLGFVALTLAFLLVAAWVAFRAHPKDVIGKLPLGADDDVPSLSLILAAGAAAASVFVGLAALHAAAAMRVLARDRRIPPPLSPEMRKLRGAVLTPLGPAPAAGRRAGASRRASLPDASRGAREDRCG